MENSACIGKKGTDRITGFSGVITGYWISATGSNRILLEGVNDIGSPIDFWADEERVSIEG